MKMVEVLTTYFFRRHRRWCWEQPTGWRVLARARPLGQRRRHPRRRRRVTTTLRRVRVIRINSNKWTPAPREFSTFSFCNRRCYLFGGLNYDTNNEMAQFRFHEHQQAWANIKYDSNDRILGRCRHSACSFGDKIYIYGGCFMFNRKRQLRECTS